MANKNLNDLANAIGDGLAGVYCGGTVGALWPFTARDLAYYLGPPFSKDFLRLLDKAKESKGCDKIAKALRYPSKLTDMMGYLMESDLNDLDKERLATHLLEILKRLREDPFSKNKDNKLINFDNKILNISMKEDSLESTNKISFLLFLYLELIYPTAMRLGYEFHGPYKIDGKMFWVKEYHNLKNPEIGDLTEFPFNDVTVIEEISSQPKVDFFNHLIEAPEKTKSALLINGEVCKELKETEQKIENFLLKFTEKANNFSKKEWLKFFAQGLYFSIKPIFELVGEEGNIPKELLERIESKDYTFDMNKMKGIEKVPAEVLSKKLSKSFLKNAFGQSTE